MVPGSTLMYGSSLMLVTRMPRDSRIAAREAAAMPFPREETTPPVTKTYLVIYLGRVGMDKFTGISVGPPILVRRCRSLPGFDPHQVVVGIDRRVAIDAVADFQVLCRPRRAVDEVVRVALARRIRRSADWPPGPSVTRLTPSLVRPQASPRRLFARSPILDLNGSGYPEPRTTGTACGSSAGSFMVIPPPSGPPSSPRRGFPR